MDITAGMSIWGHLSKNKASQALGIEKHWKRVIVFYEYPLVRDS